ncbi:MAG: thioredoxin family protein, partial [Deferrisomatales bacterium]
AALPAPAAAPLAPGERVAFLELGSAGCVPCEAMKPVLEAATREYGDRVEVVYHDVRKDPTPAREHRIRLIPTQVFLLPDGAEFFRHEGYLPLERVEEVLYRMGVRRPGSQEGPS